MQNKLIIIQHPNWIYMKPNSNNTKKHNITSRTTAKRTIFMWNFKISKLNNECIKVSKTQLSKPAPIASCSSWQKKNDVYSTTTNIHVFYLPTLWKQNKTKSQIQTHTNTFDSHTFSLETLRQINSITYYLSIKDYNIRIQWLYLKTKQNKSLLITQTTPHHTCSEWYLILKLNKHSHVRKERRETLNRIKRMHFSAAGTLLYVCVFKW